MNKRFIGKKHTEEAKAKISAGLLRSHAKTGRKFSDASVFVENSTYKRSHIKSRIIKGKLIPYECQLCGLKDEWNGKELVLRLDHKSGVNNDHRIENLRFLCPNCDSQEPTYCGRNVKKKLTSGVIEARKALNL